MSVGINWVELPIQAQVFRIDWIQSNCIAPCDLFWFEQNMKWCIKNASDTTCKPTAEWKGMLLPSGRPHPVTRCGNPPQSPLGFDRREREVGALASRLLQCKLTTNRFKKNCYGARNSRYTDSRQQTSALTCARSHWLAIPDSLGVMSTCFRDVAGVRAKGHGSERPAGRPASAG
jgi:hypothetical protein